MKFIIFLLVLSLSHLAMAKSKKPTICADTDKIAAEAVALYSESDDPVVLDGPTYKGRTKSSNRDRWEVSMVARDMCYSTVTIYTEPGSCQKAAFYKSGETCTDD